jgi:hypothetical protein
VRTTASPWGTKSFEFWTLLMVVLYWTRPQSIVELGSGRSTSYLTEYAMKQKIRFVSVEDNRFYAARTRLGLRNSFLTADYLRYVPTGEDGWYCVEKLDRVVDFRCELLFVDGPTEFNKEGSRRTERSRRWLRDAVEAARIVIVDDVHRQSGLDLLEELLSARSGSLRPMYLSYTVRPEANVIAVAVETCVYDALRSICRSIGIDVSDAYPADLAEGPGAHSDVLAPGGHEGGDRDGAR